MDHPFAFRPGTCDEEIFRHVAQENEYCLPESFQPDDIILDIGTHIGSFSYAAALRGARQIHTFEPFRENHECAMRNLTTVSNRVSLNHAAVWRSDRRKETLFFKELKHVNNAAGHVLGTQGAAVPAVGLDEIILRASKKGRRRIRLIKIDCEGSEYPILFTSKMLYLVDEIVGEYHNFTTEQPPEHPFHKIAEKARVDGFERYTIEELARFLDHAGFSVSIKRHGQIPTLAGWFFAVRRDVPPTPPSRWNIWKRKAARLLAPAN
ncbi:MAG: hypothetical protein NVSMB9_26840 [Isosphaeraceae bacterium]